MSQVTMLISIDFIQADAVREPLQINVVTTGVTPTDDLLIEIIADEVKQHLAKHAWEAVE